MRRIVPAKSSHLLGHGGATDRLYWCGQHGGVYFLLPWLDQPDEVLDIIGPYWFGIAFSLIPFSVFYTLKGFLIRLSGPGSGYGWA